MALETLINLMVVINLMVLINLTTLILLIPLNSIFCFVRQVVSRGSTVVKFDETLLAAYYHEGRFVNL